MSTTAKLVPTADQDSQGFWSAASEQRLVVQRCLACGHRQLYPRLYCRRCHTDQLVLADADGSGEVYAVTVVRRAPMQAFAPDVPYCIALVRLAEGPMMMASVVGCAAQDVRIGMAVLVDFGDVRDGVAVPRFRVAGAADG